jgi:type IV secretion system protein VirB1
LMQVNSRNLAALGTSIAHVLDPCTNIRSGAAILTADYAQAVRSHGEGQVALRAALSAYNTGDFTRGFGNGYVTKYHAPGGVPARAGGVRPAAAIPNPYTAETQIYIRKATNFHVD